MEDDERGQGAGGVSTLPTVETQLPLTQFTEVLADTPVHFQLLDLGEQLMVWIGTGGARLENLSVAMPTKCGPAPRPRPARSVCPANCLRLLRPPLTLLGGRAHCIYHPTASCLAKRRLLSRCEWNRGAQARRDADGGDGAGRWHRQRRQRADGTAAEQAHGTPRARLIGLASECHAATGCGGAPPGGGSRRRATCRRRRRRRTACAGPEWQRLAHHTQHRAAEASASQ
jgi:hypothetical protein